MLLVVLLLSFALPGAADCQISLNDGQGGKEYLLLLLPFKFYTIIAYIIFPIFYINGKPGGVTLSQTAQVSDTTGDAMKCKSPLIKNPSNKKPRTKFEAFLFAYSLTTSLLKYLSLLYLLLKSLIQAP